MQNSEGLVVLLTWLCWLPSPYTKDLKKSPNLQGKGVRIVLSGTYANSKPLLLPLVFLQGAAKEGAFRGVSTHRLCWI